MNLLVVTSATLLVTGALLVVTMCAISNKCHASSNNVCYWTLRMRCESEAKHLDLALGQDEAAQQYGPQALERPFSTVIRVIVVSLQETPFDVTTT